VLVKLCFCSFLRFYRLRFFKRSDGSFLLLQGLILFWARPRLPRAIGEAPSRFLGYLSIFLPWVVVLCSFLFSTALRRHGSHGLEQKSD